MEQDTFRLKLSKLIQKTRKALRLYSGGQTTVRNKFSAGEKIDFSAYQVQQWKQITQDLLQKIAPLLEQSHSRKLVAQFYGVRDQFYTEWRLIQADLHQKQQELIEAGESGDFVKASKVSLELVQLKARMQACQAAHNELQSIVKQQGGLRENQGSVISESHVQEDVTTVSSPSEDYATKHHYASGGVDQEQYINHAKVIPLRRKQV